ncbi:MAG: PEP-CTERM sorting domain-containing protein [Methylococcaceae bacterium]|nr:PEP-CTERM sorting domain-containing protein [Methylococcaceae bacterium]
MNKTNPNVIQENKPMKYIIIPLATALLAMNPPAWAANIGVESASAYSTATWLEASGSGIGKWYFSLDATSVKGIGDSSQGGRVSVGSSAFNLQPGLSWNQYANAYFVFEGGALAVGQSVTLDANYLFNGGVRGIQFQAGGTSLFRVEQSFSDAIQLKGTGLTDADIITTAQNAYQRALTYSVTQIDASNVEFKAFLLGSTTPTYSSTIASSGISQIHFYAGDQQTVVGDQPSYGMYFNNISVIPEPSTPLLMGLGLAGLLALRKTRKT